MDGELVNSLSETVNPLKEGNGGIPVPHSYSEIFKKQFPYYLYCGMTVEQYWDDDPELTIYYREADKLRKERENNLAWLQGMYIYDLLGRLSPVMAAFPKKGTTAKPYVDKPYDLALNPKPENVETQKADEEKKIQYKGMEYIQKFASQFNKGMQKEGE